MFFDLNVVLPTPALLNPKAKPKEQSHGLVFSPSQLAAIETRIDILVHLGYTVLALNQTVQSRLDSRTHVDWLQGLVPRLKQRQGVAVLKRLTLVLDEQSDKGNGINAQNAALLANYDILALHPTAPSALSTACLTHTVPSPHTTHILSLPLSLPRLPFHLKHTLIRTALKHGAAFEIPYAGAIAPESDRRNWWGSARELVRVTHGKGILLTGGATEDKDLRAPRDAANLITLLGIPQNLSHDAITQTPKSITLRAQSRKTYRAVLSEPKLVLPVPPSPCPSHSGSEGEIGGPAHQQQEQGQGQEHGSSRPPSLHPESTVTLSASGLLSPTPALPLEGARDIEAPAPAPAPVMAQQEEEQGGAGQGDAVQDGTVVSGSGTGQQQQQTAAQKGKKRRREGLTKDDGQGGGNAGGPSSQQKKRRKR